MACLPWQKGKRRGGKKKKKKKDTRVKLMSYVYIVASYVFPNLVPSYARHGLVRERKEERESRGDLFQSGNKTRETNWRKYFFGRRGNRYSAEFASVPVTMQWLEKGANCMAIR